METKCIITETEKTSTHLEGEKILKGCQSQSCTIQTLNKNILGLKIWNADGPIYCHRGCHFPTVEAAQDLCLAETGIMCIESIEWQRTKE